MMKTIAVLFVFLPLLVFGFPDKTDLLATINYARTNPTDFANVVEDKYLNFKRFKWIIGTHTYLTSDGVNAVKEVVSVLRAASPVRALQNEKGLDVTAQVQANFLKNQSPLPANPYLGCRSANIGLRISELGKWTKVAESISGRMDDAEDVIVQLLVSDGDARKGHRLNLLNPDYNQVGFGFSNHASVPNIIVFHYAQDFQCNQNVCPNIPLVDNAFNCQGAGYEYAGASILQLPILALIALLSLYLL